MLKNYLLLVLLALAGCATRPPLSRPVAVDYCAPPVAYHHDPAYAPLADFEAALTPALLARYPRRSLLAANASGILPQLSELLRLQAAARQQPGPAAELAVLRLRQLLLAQVVLTNTTLASVAAELDCEGERADQVGGLLSKQNGRRTQRLNALSFLAGAVTGIGTTVSTTRGGQYGYAIGGGLLTATLGLLTLTGGSNTTFTHARNLLADVWTGQSTSDVFPPSVWYMLTDPAFSNKGERSIAYNTRLRWQHYNDLARPDSKQGRALVALLFGLGGQYSADQLTLRANMLNELQSAVRQLYQEQQGLLLALSEQ